MVLLWELIADHNDDGKEENSKVDCINLWCVQVDPSFIEVGTAAVRGGVEASSRLAFARSVKTDRARSSAHGSFSDRMGFGMLSGRYVVDHKDKWKEESSNVGCIKTLISLHVTVYQSMSIGQYAISSNSSID